MILCDGEIRVALKHGQIIINPAPAQHRFTTSAVDLTLGDTDFKRWQAPGPGVHVAIDPSHTSFYRDSLTFLTDIPRETDGSGIIKPDEFLLALTKEWLELPIESRLAARVEGKSSLAHRIRRSHHRSDYSLRL